jgi:hypothetical protein
MRDTHQPFQMALSATFRSMRATKGKSLSTVTVPKWCVTIPAHLARVKHLAASRAHETSCMKHFAAAQNFAVQIFIALPSNRARQNARQSAQDEHAGTRCRSKEDPVPTYEIVYLDDDGKLAFKFAAECEDEKGAKIMAHAMKEREYKRFEVWDDKSALVYCRPASPNL